MHPSQDTADELIAKIKHYLITLRGRLLRDATDAEFYLAFCFALKEQITLNWTAHEKSQREANPRTLYYLSLEYLPGRFIVNNIDNMGSMSLVQEVLKKTGRDFTKLITAEFDPGLGNGGLGRLAACFMESLSTQMYPARGYGLRYQYGIFDQEIWEGVQVERPDKWLFHFNPWERRNDMCAQTVHFCSGPPPEGVHVDDLWKHQDVDEVRALAFDYPIVGQQTAKTIPVLPLRLWSTEESPSNFKLQKYNAGDIGTASENITLTHVLYPNDNNEVGKRIRLKQEFLLVSASLQDMLGEFFSRKNPIEALSDKVRIQMNDTHPALAVAELVRLLTEIHHMPWDHAFKTTTEVCGFTIHTILKEAHEEWPEELLKSLLPKHYAIIQKLDASIRTRAAEKFNNDPLKINSIGLIQDGRVRMTPLAIYGSHKVNGVAKLHSEILKNEVCYTFNELFPERFINVTNGVTHRKWLIHSNPRLADLITKCIGDQWIQDFSKIKDFGAFADKKEVQDVFLEVKKRSKEKLINFIKTHITHRESHGKEIHDEDGIHTDAIFDIQVKRIHEYKRQLLSALHAIMLYHHYLENPDSKRPPRVLIFAGKAAPGYEIAKNIIRLINCIGRKVDQDPKIKGNLRVLFIENYNVSRAQIIIPAADISEQISLAGMEASGTGNMKLSMNGALTVGTEDGANIEMRESVGDDYWPFKFGLLAQDVNVMLRDSSYNPRSIYERNPKIKKAVDALVDGTFATNESEKAAFSAIYESLFEGVWSGRPDRYFVLHDLESYEEIQLKVEQLYQNRNEWARLCLHNIAGMGPFAVDNTIRNYARNVWGIEPCPTKSEIYDSVEKEYSEL
jgi:glycogen phosphorylase